MRGSPVHVEVTLRNREYNSEDRRYVFTNLFSASNNFTDGVTGTLSLPIDKTANCRDCQLHIRGQGGLQFERTQYVSVNGQTVVVLVQTDKPLYKPGQTVRFRALAVYPDLKMYTGSFKVEIKDPKDNKIKIMEDLSDSSGVVEGELELSEQPVFGEWKIVVYLNDHGDTETQTFSVAQYDLPRYEITVELAPYGLLSETTLAGKVKAEYTFGQPVKGMVELHIGPNTGPNSCGVLPKTTQIAFEIDGEAEFTVPLSDVRRAVNLFDKQNVKVTAFVTEEATNVRLNGSAVLTYHSDEFQVKFLDNTPNVFKPGLPYVAYIQVTTPDDLPPDADQDSSLAVFTEVRYQMTSPEQSFYVSGQFTGTYPLPGENVTLPANGIVPVAVDIPSNATQISIKATYQSYVATKTVSKAFSSSDNYIQVSLLDKNVQAGTTVTAKIEATEPLDIITYKILSRGSEADFGVISGLGQTSMTFDIDVTPAMAPTAHLLVYYTAHYSDDDVDVVADSLAFKVEGIFENEVSIAFSTNQTQPGSRVNVEMEARPGSQVFVLAIDQSVLLLKTGNDITPEKVNDAVVKFDKGQQPSDSEFALSYSADNTQQVFTRMGLEVITDLPLASRPTRFYSRHGANVMDYSPHYDTYDSPAMMGPSGMFINEQPSYITLPPTLTGVERVRDVFPEAWMWMSSTTNSNGRARIRTYVPDTITSWVASAFATHSIYGLGVAPTTAKLKVFSPFFVSLTYPRKLIRNEQAVVQATVFNYLPQDAWVTVTLHGNRRFKSVIVSPDGTEVLETGDRVVSVHVRAYEQGVVFFPVKATKLGVVNIRVTAQTSMAADSVRRQIIVAAEGAPVNFNYPMFIKRDGNEPPMQDTVNFPFPSSLVSGSIRANAKVTGDLVGFSLHSLSSLIRLPTGCGEQSMVKFAPDLYIAKYLRATNQFTDYVEQRLMKYLDTGYQRQLSYQRYDGGFSAFGNLDQSGSTWLTAFVSRAMSEAREFIYVDPSMLVRAVDWLVHRQNQDGSFTEVGQVLDSRTQGDGSTPSLTAFVLTSLMENMDLSGLEECETSNKHCNRAYKWGNATEKATDYLEHMVDSNDLNDAYTLSLVSYALRKAGHPISEIAFARLLDMGQAEGGLLYWNEDPTSTDSYTTWRPPRVQSRPINIQIASYALLYLTANQNVEDGLPIVRWLTRQRNPFGGFVSTQDTSVGLQALSAYATISVPSNNQLSISVRTSENDVNFQVTRENSLILQSRRLTGTPTQAQVQATGSGFALLEMDYSFNVKEELTAPAFDVSPVLLDESVDSFNLMVCTKWLSESETGMVVQEISIPSGFTPDLTSLHNVAGLKKPSRKGDVVEIYFDKITKTSICYSVLMTRSSKVARTQKNYVRTYDYYDPDSQSTIFYQPRKLRDSTICDVCYRCCVPTSDQDGSDAMNIAGSLGRNIRRNARRTV